MILLHGVLELGSTTTTCVVPSRPGGEAVVVNCISLEWPAGAVGDLILVLSASYMSRCSLLVIKVLLGWYGEFDESLSLLPV